MKRRKTRLKRVLLWTATIVIAIGVTGLFAVNYAINKALDAMVAGLEAELELSVEQKAEEFSKEMSESENALDLADIPSSTTSYTSNELDPEASHNPESSKPSVAAPVESDNSNARNLTNKSKITTSNSKPADDSGQEKSIKYSAEISIDKAELVKEKISVTEKATVAKIMASNLGASELKQLQEMASGGLNIEEKRAARKILLDKLSPSEYDELIQIAKKYGLSEGKKYSEAIKEEQISENDEKKQ